MKVQIIKNSLSIFIKCVQGENKIMNVVDMVILILISFFPALIDSSLGMGYGFTVTPLLLLIGYSPVEAVPAVLVSSVVGDLLGTYFHQEYKNVNFSFRSRSFKIALVIGVLGGIGALFGALVAMGISTLHLKTYIGVLVTVLGIFVLFSDKLRIKINFSWPKMIMMGIVGAFNKGVSGSGFGPVVTTGGLLSGLDEKATVAIQCLSELPVCIIGFLTFMLKGSIIKWDVAICVSIGAALSSPVAAWFVHKIPSGKLRPTIGVMAVILGLSTLVKAYL